MIRIRRLVHRSPLLALWLVLAVLGVKLLTPVGYMPTISAGTITVSMCSGTGPQTMTMQIPGLPVPADTSHDRPGAQMPCAFAGLGLLSLAAVDPILLALALVFVMALGVAATVRPRASDPAYLRPPLRGPPAVA